MSTPPPSAFLSASPSDAVVAAFGNRARAKRYDATLVQFARAGAVTVAAAARTEADRHGAYRLLHNPAVSPVVLAAAARARATARLPDHAGAPALLALSDTTAVDLSHLAGAIAVTDADVGPIESRGRTPGFFAHATLLVAAPGDGPGPGGAPRAHPQVLGLIGCDTFARAWAGPDKTDRDYRTLAPRDKEQGKWHRSRDHVVAAGLATAPAREAGPGEAGPRPCYWIGDREADAYPDLLDASERACDFVVRVAQDRRVRAAPGYGGGGGGGPQLISALVASWAPDPVPLLVEVPAGDGADARTARLAVRYGACFVDAPAKRGTYRPPNARAVLVGVVDVREVDPPREPRALRTGAAWPADAAPAPIHWRLYCSRVPGDREAAARMVGYYAYRWRVECLFATGKSRGFGAEGTQLRSGRALQNAAVMAMTAAAQRVERLCGARDGADLAPAYEVLGYDDAAFLAAANARVETPGTTVVNPHPPGTVSYVSWVVARFGSWTGLPSEGPCGSRRMARGYVRLAEFRAGYLAAMARPPDPCQESGQ